MRRSLTLKMLSLSVVGAVLVSCAQRSDDDVLVLNALLREACASERIETVLTATSEIVVGAFLTKGLDPGALDDLVLRNKAKIALPRGIRCPGVRIMTSQEIDLEQQSQKPGEPIYGAGIAGAGTLVSVSQPGYSTSRDTAIVYVSVQCGVLCGNRTFVQFSRGSGGEWVQEKFYMVEIR